MAVAVFATAILSLNYNNVLLFIPVSYLHVHFS